MFGTARGIGIVTLAGGLGAASAPASCEGAGSFDNLACPLAFGWIAAGVELVLGSNGLPKIRGSARAVAVFDVVPEDCGPESVAVVESSALASSEVVVSCRKVMEAVNGRSGRGVSTGDVTACATMGLSAVFPGSAVDFEAESFCFFGGALSLEAEGDALSWDE